MKRELKFKRAYFEGKNHQRFIGFKIWGVGVDDSIFTSPSHLVASCSFTV